MSFDDQTQKSFSELVLPFRSALSRFWNVSWAPALVIAGLVIVASFKIPSYYVSNALISVQPNRVNKALVQSPGTAEDKADDTKVDSIVNEMLSRPRLKSILDKHQLYPDYEGIVGREKALRRFREAISTIPAVSKTGRVIPQTFVLEYTHEDPKIAFEITKELSNLFIEQSTLSTIRETQGTEEFLDAQLRAARQRLESTEEQVQSFVRENFGKLPEHLDAAVARLRNAEARLQNNTQLITANMTRLQSLRSELSIIGREGPVAIPSAGGGGNDGGDSLAQLEETLAILRTKYSEEHPDVIATKRRIELFKKQNGAADRGDKKGGTTYVPRSASGDARSLRLQIGEVEAQLAQFRTENDHLKKEIDDLNKDINEMPLKEQELVKIKRDYANVKSNYERLLAAREAAGLQSDLVSSQKDSQFSIVDPPALPIIPAGPNRPLIAGIGVVVGILVFFTLPLGLYFMNSSFKFRDEVEDELGVPVLGIIPPLEPPPGTLRQPHYLTTSVAVSLLSFAVGAVVLVVIL